MIGVRLPGINMNGLPDGDGDIFRIYDVEGLDSAETDSSLSQLSQDGAVVEFGRMKERNLLIRGNAWTGGNDANIWRVRRKIETCVSSMLYNLAMAYFDVPSPGISYQMACQKLGKLHFATPNGTVQPFELPLVAPDPRKYWQTAHSTVINSATATVTNGGNYYSHPIATLNSAGSSLWLQNNTVGAYTRLTINPASLSGGVLPAGSTLDFYRRQLNVAGVGPRDLINMPRTWWTIGPGANSISTNGNWTLTFNDCDS